MTFFFITGLYRSKVIWSFNGDVSIQVYLLCIFCTQHPLPFLSALLITNLITLFKIKDCLKMPIHLIFAVVELCLGAMWKWKAHWNAMTTKNNDSWLRNEAAAEAAWTPCCDCLHWCHKRGSYFKFMLHI